MSKERETLALGFAVLKRAKEKERRGWRASERGRPKQMIEESRSMMESSKRRSTDFFDDISMAELGVSGCKHEERGTGERLK